jgi:hypothetical protein
LEDIASSPAPTWETIFGLPIELPGTTGLLTPDDPIIPIDADGTSNSPGNEQVVNAIDGSLAKYLNFGEVNSGFIVTPSTVGVAVKSFQITTANDAVERDPSAWQLFGTNDPIASVAHSTGTAESWTLIGSGALSLPSARNTAGAIVDVTNNTAYASYKMIFTGVKNAAGANSMQIAEIQFFGDSAMGTPPTLRLEDADSGALLLQLTGTDAPGNTVANPPILGVHADVRLVLQAGS